MRKSSGYLGREADNEEEWCIMRKSGGQLERVVDNEKDGG
jgi:hypothetical protein